MVLEYFAHCLLWVGVIYLLVELFLKTKITFEKISKLNAIVAIVIGAIAGMCIYPLVHAPRMTLANIDQGVPITFFSGIYLPITLGVISLAVISIGLLVFNIVTSAGVFRFLFDALTIVSILAYCGVYFLNPFLFWVGINPVILTLLTLGLVGSLPMVKKVV